MLVIPWHPVVPNLATILTSVPANATWFPVVDFCSAFFTILLHPSSRFLFFIYIEREAMNMGLVYFRYIVSLPQYFSQVLKTNLDSITFT